jgi:hypothetical protein
MVMVEVTSGVGDGGEGRRHRLRACCRERKEKKRKRKRGPRERALEKNGKRKDLTARVGGSWAL